MWVLILVTLAAQSPSGGVYSSVTTIEFANAQLCNQALNKVPKSMVTATSTLQVNGVCVQKQ